AAEQVVGLPDSNRKSRRDPTAAPRSLSRGQASASRRGPSSAANGNARFGRTPSGRQARRTRAMRQEAVEGATGALRQRTIPFCPSSCSAFFATIGGVAGPCTGWCNPSRPAPTGATPFKGGAPERAKSGHSINPFCEIAGARAPRTPFAAVHEFAPQHRPAEAHIAKVLPKPLAPAGPNHFEPPPRG